MHYFGSNFMEMITRYLHQIDGK